MWFGPLPTVAVAAVAMLCGLGVDFAIHYAARYRRARLEFDHAEAVRRVQVATVPELLIDMATTAVTFLAVGSGQLSGLPDQDRLAALKQLMYFPFELEISDRLVPTHHRLRFEQVERILGERAAR